MRAENPDHQKRPIRQPTIDLLRQQLHKGQVNTTLHSLRGLRLHRSLRSGFVSSTQPYPVFFSTASPFSPTVGWLVNFYPFGVSRPLNRYPYPLFKRIARQPDVG